MSPFGTLCEEVENSLWFNFSKDKYKALPWGKHNPGVQHKLGFTQFLGSSSVEKGPGVLMDNKLNRSEQCSAAAKKDQRMLDSIKKASPAEIKEVIIPLYSAFVRPPLKYCVPFWSLLDKKKRCRQARQGSEKGQKDDQMGSLPFEQRLRALFVQPGEKKA